MRKINKNKFKSRSNDELLASLQGAFEKECDRMVPHTDLRDHRDIDPSLADDYPLCTAKHCPFNAR